MTSWQLPLFRFFEPSGFRSEQYSNKIPLVRKKGGRNRDQTTLVAILIETAKLWWILSKTCFRFSKTKTLYKFEAFGWYHHCRSHARTSGKSWFWTTRWNTFLKSNFVFFLGLSIRWFTDHKGLTSSSKTALPVKMFRQKSWRKMPKLQLRRIKSSIIERNQYPKKFVETMDHKSIEEKLVEFLQLWHG